ncbi:putative bifunctional diguanylate cyclase/phosphodiesterase [Sulfurivermis fontis]|uniref:putative bifunctional diguanylate cyclase/phosphodiesterase n=1 Tax=Sulfurivermis fontis TaxID=1972068 RepID=UPI000FDCD1CA|nr:EAL domain-containing protein [Sulfurivermis fontis]
MDYPAEYFKAIQYIRAKVDQMLTLIGTLPLRPEELDDKTLIDLDPIGIVTESFRQVLDHLNDTNRALDVAKQEIRAIFDAMDAAVVVLDEDGRIDDCNRQAREWLFHNREHDEIVGQTLDTVCVCSSHMQANLTSGQLHEHEFQVAGRHLQIVASDIHDAQRNKIKKVFICFDITRQKNIEASLQLYAKVFANTAEGIAITDAETRYLEVNDAFCRITGYSETELLGQTPKMLQSGRHDEEFYAALRHSLATTGQWQGEILDRAKDGRIIPLLLSINTVYDADGNLTNYITIVTDITSLKETQTRLDFLAHHDPLTELPNRLLFTARLEHAIERAARDHDLFGLLFIDLDRFKTINDSLGHQFGDRLLIEVARRLRGLVRRADTIARLGGDEFVVLLERLNIPGEATTLAHKIVSAMRQPFHLHDSELHVGCSIGITLYPEDGTDAVTLLKNADTAMYRVKDSGRDGYCKFSPDLSEAADEKLTLENALRLAIRDQQLLLHYQPIIDLRQQRIIAVEALARWPHAERGMVPPDQFIPLAEETKLILPLGAWVAGEAIAQFMRWRAQGIAPEYISINASGVQLFHPSFADTLFALLREHQMEGRCLQVELTENVLLRDINSCRHVLERLRDHGVRIAIDDFGTGYSSLAYLKQLPIDDLKIDRSFVRDIPGDANDCAITEAIIGMARNLGLETVAEGVETLEQEKFLAHVGCNKVQGYHYARPLTASGFADFHRHFGKR